MTKFLTLLFTTFIFQSVFASYLDEQGNFHREWFAHNTEQVEKIASNKREVYTNHYFENWFQEKIEETDLREEKKQLLGESLNLSQGPEYFLCEDSELSCRLNLIFGYEKSIKLLYIIHEFGYNPSHLFTSRDFSAPYEEFSDEELVDVITAMALFDSKRLKNQRKRFIRFTNYSNGNSIANGRIHLFASWRKLARADRVAVVVHEIGHNIGYMRPNNDLSMSSYQVSKEWTSLYEQGCHISEYAKASQYEAFAESVSLFKLDPQTFKAVCPKNYQYLRSVFDQ